MLISWKPMPYTFISPPVASEIKSALTHPFHFARTLFTLINELSHNYCHYHLPVASTPTPPPKPAMSRRLTLGVSQSHTLSTLPETLSALQKTTQQAASLGI